MNKPKPKYKLGDIVYNSLCDVTELIVSMEIIYSKFVWYRIMMIDGCNDGEYSRRSERTLNKLYEVVGNILEDKHGCNC